jgi:hypothetical protein
MKRWIQKTGIKRIALSRQLGIPEKKNIPMGLLNKIIKSKPGKTIRYGHKKIKITRKLERRAILARTLKRIRR